jgi:hypothetical protein
MVRVGFFYPYLSSSRRFSLFSLTSAMSASEHDHQNDACGLVIPDLSGAVPTSAEARAKRRIAALEEELQMVKQERGTKQRFVTYHLARYMPPAD